jgi:hypothetical protein
MSTNITLKRSAQAGKVPATTDLALGEMAINTYDGKLYIKKDVSGTESIVEVGAGLAVADQTIVEDVFTGNGSTTAFTLSVVPIADRFAFITINGVHQENTTYSISGTTLTFTEAPATNDVIEVRTFVPYVAEVTLRDYKRYFYTMSNAATASGADDNGATLAYDFGFVEVYLNGVRLIDAVDYTATNGTSVVTTSNVTGILEIVSLAKAAFLDSGLTNVATALTTTTSNQIADSFPIAAYRTAKYVVQMATSSDYHVTEVMTIHDDTTVYLTEYGTIYTNASLGTIDANIVNGEVRLLVSPVNVNTDIKVVRTNIGV